MNGQNRKDVLPGLTVDIVLEKRIKKRESLREKEYRKRYSH